MRSKSDEFTEYDRTIAVLTGDLVGSRQRDNDTINAAMERIMRTARDIGDMVEADTRFTRFRGDGWQIVLGRAGWALRATLVIIADLKAGGKEIETRISVGVGPWQSLGTDDLSDAAGQAFAVSGTHLDKMPKHKRMTIADAREDTSQGQENQDWPAAIFDMAEWISSRWSKPQAEAMAMALRGDWKTQDQLARYLGITRQAMHARLSGAGYQAIERALAVMENNERGSTP